MVKVACPVITPPAVAFCATVGAASTAEARASSNAAARLLLCPRCVAIAVAVRPAGAVLARVQRCWPWLAGSSHCCSHNQQRLRRACCAQHACCGAQHSDRGLADSAMTPARCWWQMYTSCWWASVKHILLKCMLPLRMAGVVRWSRWPESHWWV
jgi:hypothetical protein